MTTTRSGIYKITNIKNKKVYIGSAHNISNRFSTHKYTLKNNKHKNPHLQASWNKYGESNFIFEILEIVDNLDHLLEREQYYINFFTSYLKQNGYNIAKNAGNTAGIKPTQETKLKQSISAKKRIRHKMSPEQLLKLKERYKNSIPPWAKLNWDIINDIRNLYESGETQKNLAAKYNLAQTTVSEIIRNIIWKNENYSYKKRKNG